MGVADHFRNEDQEKLIERLKKEAEKLGLYLHAAQPVIPPEMANHEDPPVFLSAMFQIGEKAFEPGALEEDPLKADEARKFAELERSFNDPTAEIRESLAKGGILDLDEEIEDLP